MLCHAFFFFFFSGLILPVQRFCASFSHPTITAAAVAGVRFYRSPFSYCLTPRCEKEKTSEGITDSGGSRE
ncbi:hypothetical protein B0T14DRAFT_523277 [Immersiella caudata]|uniref:Secreted protein n=1 Tax=Immersiella caudata TaxID=314043 RepID=A0AA39WJK7_9PEZI|nr:hypothetical protein B0T14DRAFT_523277 [Immersiella caudata]